MVAEVAGLGLVAEAAVVLGVCANGGGSTALGAGSLCKLVPHSVCKVEVRGREKYEKVCTKVCTKV